MSSQSVIKVVHHSKLPNDAAKFTLFGNNLDEHFETNGKIIADSRCSWISAGPQITVINNQNGSKTNIWLNSNTTKENIVKVTCVTEVLSEWPGGNAMLAVGCEDGTLHIYHTGVSRVLRTINFNESVLCIEVVDMGIRRNTMLPEELQLMNGVLAVGLQGGAVYLIDMCRNLLERSVQEGSTWRDDRPSQLLEIDLHNDCDSEIKAKQARALRCGDTLALLLNESALAHMNMFSLQSRSGSSAVRRIPRDEVAVTSLKYFKEITCLAVGFNMSCFQLWYLPSFTLLYVSDPLMEVVLPVIDFCLLEPSDDPCSVCYVWALHQSTGENLSLPFAAMYLLNFDKKRHVRDYGSIYEEFRSCTLRFQLDLGVDVPSAKDGRVISCHSMYKSLPRRLPVYCIDQDVEESVVSLCAIAWEVWTPERFDVTTKLTLFDLNQWYRAQMPSFCTNEDQASYMSTLSLAPVNHTGGAVLDVRVSSNTIRQFLTIHPLEEHYFPSSFRFNCTCLSEREVYKCTSVGVQQELLDSLDSAGPSALINPTRVFNNFISVGLRPSFCDIHDFSSINTDTERQIVLSIMLENGNTTFLKDCVRVWADGCQSVANCTLPALIRWAWSAITTYKQVADKLCVHLFDYSGNKPDVGELAYAVRLMHSLSDLFTYILKNFRNFVLDDNLELQNRSLLLVLLYLDSVLWCVENKILPELPLERAPHSAIPYNLQSIQTKVNSRRNELSRLSRTLKNVPDGGLYLIDAFIRNEAGDDRVINQWECEGGGLYPPPSVQSMLRVNLMNGIPSHVKHSVVLYFILDLISELPQERLDSDEIKGIVNSFSIVFKMSQSHVNLMKAFWFIDNKQFEEGVKCLFDNRMEKSEISNWQHRAILRALYVQREPHIAQSYIRRMTPPLLEFDDIEFEMTLLLECGLILQAFEFQRKYKMWQTELLNTFFIGCREKKELGIVYKLSLTKFEEEAFTTFLENGNHPRSEDLRVLYLLSRARYVEAIDVNEKIRTKRAAQVNLGPVGQSPLRGSFTKQQQRNYLAKYKEESRSNIRDIIVSGFAKTLPPVTKELADYCLKHKATLASWKQVERPTPLSVVIHTEAEGNRVPIYRGSSETLMQSAIMKTKEIWGSLLATPAPLKSRFRSNVEDTPFLRKVVLSSVKSSRYSLEHDVARSLGNEKKRDRDDAMYNEDDLQSLKRIRYDEKLSTRGDRSFTLSTPKVLRKDDLETTLLLTPHVKKKISVPVSVTPQRATPQSILKSPWKGKGTPRLTPKASPVSFAKEVIERDELSQSKLKERELPACSSPLPRQIRFSLPSDENMDDDDNDLNVEASGDSAIKLPSDLDASAITPTKRRSIHSEVLNQLDEEDEEEEDVSENVEIGDVNVQPEEVRETTVIKSDDKLDESGVETLSSKTSTLTSVDNDVYSVPSANVSSQISTTSTDVGTEEFLSLSEDNKDSSVTSSLPVTITSSGSENDYEDVENNAGRDEELPRFSPHFSKNDDDVVNVTVKRTVFAADEVSLNEVDENQQQTVEEHYENEVKTYASLKTVDTLYPCEEDVDMHGDVESENEYKKREINNEYGENEGLEDYDEAAGDEDLDIYAGLEEDVETHKEQHWREENVEYDNKESKDEQQEEKDVSGSSDVICLESSDEETENRDRHDPFSEELDYNEGDDDEQEEEEEEYDEEEDEDFDAEDENEERLTEELLRQNEDDDDDDDVEMDDEEEMDDEPEEDDYEVEEFLTKDKESEKSESEEKVTDEKHDVSITEIDSTTSENEDKELEGEVVEEEDDADSNSNIDIASEKSSHSDDNCKSSEEFEITDVTEKIEEDEQTPSDAVVTHEVTMNKSEDLDVIKLQISSTDICNESNLNAEIGESSMYANDQQVRMEEESFRLEFVSECDDDSNNRKDITLVTPSMDQESSQDTSVTIGHKSSLNVIPEEPVEMDVETPKKNQSVSGIVPEETKIAIDENVVNRSIFDSKRKRRRSKSAEVEIPHLSTGIHKSSSFTNINLSGNISEVESSNKDAEPSTSNLSVKNNQDVSRLSMKSSRSRRSSSVSNLSEMSSRYSVGGNSRRFSSTSSLLFDLSKSQSIQYDTVSKLDTSLGTYIKKLKNEKPSQQKSSRSSTSYRSSIRKKKTDDDQELSLIVESSGDDESEKDEKVIQVKKRSKRNVSKSSSSNVNEDLDDKISDECSKVSHNVGGDAPMETLPLEENKINVDFEMDEGKSVSENNESEVVEETLVKINEENNVTNVPVSEKTIVETEVTHVSNKTIVNETVVEPNRETDVEDSLAIKKEAENVIRDDFGEENIIKIQEVSTQDRDCDAGSKVESLSQEKDRRNGKASSVVSDITSSAIKKQVENVMQGDSCKDSIVQTQEVSTQDRECDALTSSKVGSLSQENLVGSLQKKDRRNERASSVISDITPLVGKRSDFPGQLQSSDRRKSISFHDINKGDVNDEMKESKHYSARAGRKSKRFSIYDLTKGIDSYSSLRKSFAFDPHKTRASSVSGIDDTNISTASSVTDNSRRKTQRFSRYRDRTSLRPSTSHNFMGPQDFDVVNSEEEDETNTVSYTETNVKGSSILDALIEKNLNKKTHIPELKDIEQRESLGNENPVVTEESNTFVVEEAEKKDEKPSGKRQVKRSKKSSQPIIPDDEKLAASEDKPSRKSKSLSVSKPASDTKNDSAEDESSLPSSSDKPLAELISKHNEESLSEDMSIDVKSKKLKKMPKKRQTKKTSKTVKDNAKLTEVIESESVSDTETEQNKTTDSKSKKSTRRSSKRDSTSGEIPGKLTSGDMKKTKTVQKRRSSANVSSKSSSVFDDSESEDDGDFGDSSAISGASSTPIWKRSLRNSKLLDVPPSRRSKLKNMFDSLEMIPSEEEEEKQDEDDKDVSPKKWAKESPEKKSTKRGKATRKLKGNDTTNNESDDKESISSPAKRKLSTSVTSEKRKKKLLSRIEDPMNIVGEDYDRSSVCSESARSTASSMGTRGRRRTKTAEKPAIDTIMEKPEEHMMTPKRNLRSSSVASDGGSMDSKRSSRTTTSEVAQRRRSLFSTPKKTQDLNESSENVEEYTLQRRLTRHQKSLLERSRQLTSSSGHAHPRELAENSDAEETEENTADTSLSSIASSATVRSSPRLKGLRRTSQRH